MLLSGSGTVPVALTFDELIKVGVAPAATETAMVTVTCEFAAKAATVLLQVTPCGAAKAQVNTPPLTVMVGTPERPAGK